jgi:hypothetical protein
MTGMPTRQDMSHADLMNAYAATKDRFGLKAKQRTALDASRYYLDIMIAAHNGDWRTASNLLQDACLPEREGDTEGCCETPWHHKPWCLNK